MWSIEDLGVAAGDSGDLAAWRGLCDEVLCRGEGRFARPQPRRMVWELVTGLRSAAERTNGWWLAERAGPARPEAR